MVFTASSCFLCRRKAGDSWEASAAHLSQAGAESSEENAVRPLSVSLVVLLGLMSRMSRSVEEGTRDRASKCSFEKGVWNGLGGGRGDTTTAVASFDLAAAPAPTFPPLLSSLALHSHSHYHSPLPISFHLVDTRAVELRAAVGGDGWGRLGMGGDGEAGVAAGEGR